MDLNSIKPEPRPLRIMRLATLDTDNGGLVGENEVESLSLPDLPVFEGGESLDEPLPDPAPLVSVEELLEAEDREWTDGDDTVIAVGLVDKGFTNEPALPDPRVKTRACPVCLEEVSVYDSGEDVLGLGMSLAAANTLEDEFMQHLGQHSAADYLGRIRDLEQQLARPKHQDLNVPLGVTPGPTKRDPEREAAVRALDARLGLPQAPLSPEQTEDRDAALRAARERRRQQKEPTAYDLTPAWRQDLESGVVGIKR